MTIPKKVKIFGQPYKVKIVELPDHIAGLCDNQKFEILLNPNQPDKEMLHTLIHEMGHATAHRTSLNQILSIELEEPMVNNFATMILENFTLT